MLTNKSTEPVYKEGTTKEQIIYDGWSRGFLIDQVVCEVTAQGLQASADEVQATFNMYQCEMVAYYARES